jgi:hypothetical protein
MELSELKEGLTIPSTKTSLECQDCHKKLEVLTKPYTVQKYDLSAIKWYLENNKTILDFITGKQSMIRCDDCLKKMEQIKINKLVEYCNVPLRYRVFDLLDKFDSKLNKPEIGRAHV